MQGQRLASGSTIWNLVTLVLSIITRRGVDRWWLLTRSSTSHWRFASLRTCLDSTEHANLFSVSFEIEWNLLKKANDECNSTSQFTLVRYSLFWLPSTVSTGGPAADICRTRLPAFEHNNGHTIDTSSEFVVGETPSSTTSSSFIECRETDAYVTAVAQFFHSRWFISRIDARVWTISRRGIDILSE